MYPCYSRRRHAILEKSGAKKIAACEKQGKQHKFGEHWKSIKSLLLKKKTTTGDDAKKIDWNTNFNKRF